MRINARDQYSNFISILVTLSEVSRHSNKGDSGRKLRLAGILLWPELDGMPRLPRVSGNEQVPECVWLAV